MTQKLISAMFLPMLMTGVILDDTSTIEYEKAEASNESIEVVDEKVTVILGKSEEYYKRQIINSATQYGVDINLSLDIAKHESRFCSDLHNPDTSATGCYQFLTKDWIDVNGNTRLSTWTSYCVNTYGHTDVLDYKQNIQCFMQMMSNDPGNITHWTADLNMRRMLINKGYVVCGEGKNNCRLK